MSCHNLIYTRPTELPQYSSQLVQSIFCQQGETIEQGNGQGVGLGGGCDPSGSMSFPCNFAFIPGGISQCTPPSVYMESNPIWGCSVIFNDNLRGVLLYMYIPDALLHVMNCAHTCTVVNTEG